MSVLHALILGLLQGATEFLPVSSSGHLVLFPFIMGWEEPTVAFDVAVHIGTLISVLIVFWDRVKPLVRALVRRDDRNRHLLTLLFVGSIPAGVAGLAFASVFESAFGRPMFAAMLLGVTGYLLILGDRFTKQHEERVAEEAAAARVAAARAQPLPETKPLKTEDTMESLDAIAVGVAQAAAILPGISRSGSTVVAGLKMGVSREAAVRFSFLLSIPAILGALIVQLPDLASQGASGDLPAILVGVAASAVSGVVAIRWFIRLFVARGLKPFAIYCFLAMIAGLLAGLARG
ncbi:MAG TPA: undecaprenyl-diphosphate phosphatase [Actinomycetota bacterium]|nr:undecaprenyl-diphosphate phosphatase [Actinomycetota bacterium]